MFLFWTNRDEPFYVQTMTVASSGRVCIVRTPKTDVIGKPMRIEFRMASKSQINTWGAATDPFSMFGHSVVWAPGNSFTYTNEVLDQSDSGVSNGNANLDLYKGTMSLIIVG